MSGCFSISAIYTSIFLYHLGECKKSYNIFIYLCPLHSQDAGKMKCLTQGAGDNYF